MLTALDGGAARLGTAAASASPDGLTGPRLDRGAPTDVDSSVGLRSGAPGMPALGSMPRG